MEKYCRSCNTANPPEAAFCRSCAGSQFYSAASATAQAPQTPFYGTPMVNVPIASGFAPQNPGPSGRAIASMVLAICSLVLCCGFLTGVPAAILGWMEVAAIKAGTSSQRGMVMAQVGLWGGIVISILSLLFSAGYLLLMVLSFSLQ